jgi:RNA polymerase subunit RPABC4/transcription elongation factor Spt4
MTLVSVPGSDYLVYAKTVALVAGLYVAAIWLTLVFWAYRDIRQRSRDPILQTVSVLLVLLFFLPGHWIYLILRPRFTLTELYERSLEEEALLQELEDQKACPTCKRRVHDDFLICPSCRTQLKEPCRSCQRPLSYAWLACPFCGLEKPARESYGARQARAAARPPDPTQRPAPSPQQRGPVPVDPATRVTRPATARPDPLGTRVPQASAGDEAPMIGE